MAGEESTSVHFDLQVVGRRTAFVVESLGSPDQTERFLTSREEFVKATAEADIPAVVEEEFGQRALALVPAAKPKAKRKASKSPASRGAVETPGRARSS